jgi:hypothetical protein
VADRDVGLLLLFGGWIDVVVDALEGMEVVDP